MREDCVGMKEVFDDAKSRSDNVAKIPTFCVRLSSGGSEVADAGNNGSEIARISVIISTKSRLDDNYAQNKTGLSAIITTAPVRFLVYAGAV